MIRKPAIAIAPLLLALAGCAPTTEGATEAQGPCKAEPVLKYVGQPFKPELAEKMKAEAGAAILRTGPENGPVTMDYNPGRLNIFYSESMKIAVVNCG